MISTPLSSAPTSTPRVQWGAQEMEAIGRSKGGLTTKIHTAVDGLGKPLCFILTPGQASDCTQAGLLLAGFPTQYVIADKGYDCKAIVEAVARSGAKAVIPVSKIHATRTLPCTPSANGSSASSTGSSTTVRARLATADASATSSASSILLQACSGGMNVNRNEMGPHSSTPR